MKKLIILLVLLFAAYFFIGNFGILFGNGLNSVKSAYEKNSLGFDSLSSADPEKNSRIYKELDSQLYLLQLAVFSKDADALKSLISSRLHLLSAAGKIYDLEKVTSSFAGGRPSCREGEEVWQAYNLLDDAKQRLSAASDEMAYIFDKYPDYAKKITSMTKREYANFISGMQVNFTNTQENLQAFCAD